MTHQIHTLKKIAFNRTSFILCHKDIGDNPKHLKHFFDVAALSKIMTNEIFLAYQCYPTTLENIR